MTNPILTPAPGPRDGAEQRQFLLGAFAVLFALALRAAPDADVRSGFWTAFAISLVFAVAARLIRGVTLTGALAGLAVSFAIIRGLGIRGFVVLFAVFLLTWISTRLGRSRKLQLSVRDDSRGRNAAQVLANVGIPALLTFLMSDAFFALWTTAIVAALAEAAADTVSSEIGESTGRTPRLITTGEAVPPGTDGGVTLIGSAAGAAAAILIAGVAFALRLVGIRAAALAAVAGILGFVFDSALGATFERRRLLNNNLVNLISTAFAAGVTVLAARYLSIY